MLRLRSPASWLASAQFEGQNAARESISINCPASSPAKLADSAKTTAGITVNRQANNDVRLGPMRSAYAPPSRVNQIWISTGSAMRLPIATPLMPSFRAYSGTSRLVMPSAKFHVKALAWNALNEGMRIMK